MEQCKNELTGMEKKVLQLKRDGEDKAMKINQLDITLQEAQSKLNEKTNEGNFAVLFLRLPFMYCFCVYLHFSFFLCSIKSVKR